MTNPLNPYTPLVARALFAELDDAITSSRALYDFFEKTGRMWDYNNVLNNVPFNSEVANSGSIALPEGYTPGETYGRGVDAYRGLPGDAPADKFSPAILAAALTIHGAAMALNGFGTPDTGDGLTTGAVVFQDVSTILGSAGSDPGWQGAGAQSYDRQNSEQQARTDQMAALDTELAGLLQTQATEVKKLRNEMYIVAGTLAGAIPVAWALYNIPVYGSAISTAFQTATAIACLGADTGLQTKQGLRSQKTGAAMDQVADRYEQIAAGAQESGPNL